MTDTPLKAWICPVCGYIHYGPEPPDECPICGTLKNEFEPYTVPQPAQPAPAPAQALKVVIAGAGIAGVSAAEAVSQAAPQAEITLLSREPDLPYYRLSLTRYLAGEVGAAELDLHPEGWYAEACIRLLRGVELSAIDLDQHAALLGDGRRLEFDKLILTVGSRSFVPPLPGVERQGVTVLRTRRDADFILQAAGPGRKCVCIGGGILGLETAAALACSGAEVTVLENMAWLLPRQLNPRAGALFQARLAALGIAVRTSAKVRDLAGDDAVRGVALEDGTLLPADLVIISAGVRPNLDAARQAGLAVNQGILVDAAMQTSHPDVYAAGDVAEHQGVLYGTWPPAQIQGTVAGSNAAGQSAEFTSLPRSNSLKVVGIDLFSIGTTSAAAETERVVDAELDGNYYCFVFRDKALVGSILLGDSTLSPKVKKIIEERIDCAALLLQNPDVQEILAFADGAQ